MPLEPRSPNDLGVLTPRGDPVITDALTVTGAGSGVVFNGDGTTTITTGGRVRANAAALYANSGWFAARIKATSGTGTSFAVASWGTTANDIIQVAWVTGPMVFRFSCGIGGATTTVDSAASFSAGDSLTLLGKWSPSQVGLSVNGSTFGTASISGVTASGSTFDIGSRSTSGSIPLMGSVHWFACGKGTLTDSDAAKFHAFGNSDPSWPQLRSSTEWRTTMLWTADDGNPSPEMVLTPRVPMAL